MRTCFLAVTLVIQIAVLSAGICRRCRIQQGLTHDSSETARDDLSDTDYEKLSQVTDDEDIQDGGSGHGMADTAEKRPTVEQMIQEYQQESMSCCRLGTLMARMNYQCKSRRFARAGRHLKEKLLQETLSEIGITADNNDTWVLVEPFRKCVLKRARDLDKCCYAKTFQHKGSESSARSQHKGSESSARRQRQSVVVNKQHKVRKQLLSSRPQSHRSHRQHQSRSQVYQHYRRQASRHAQSLGSRARDIRNGARRTSNYERWRYYLRDSS